MHQSAPATYVLGLTCGHDASASIIKDGVLVAHVLRERVSRRRHDFGIDRTMIEKALADAEITSEQVAFVAMTATQSMPLLINDRSYINYESARDDEEFGNLDLLADGSLEVISTSPHWPNPDGKLVLSRSFETGNIPDAEFVASTAAWFRGHLEHDRRIPASALHDWQIDQYLSPLMGPKNWSEPVGIEGIKAEIAEGLRHKTSHRWLHYPIAVTLDGRSVSGVFVNHHAAHAASSYYSSPFEDALIVTHDGGVGLDGGFISKGSGNRISPITPHGLALGQFYDNVAILCGLGGVGGAGKLMGLSSYGKCLNLDPSLVGTMTNWLDTKAPWRLELRAAGKLDETAGPFKLLNDYLVLKIEEEGFARESLGSGDTLHPANTAIACSAQTLVEQTMMTFIRFAQDALKDNGVSASALCLSGGVALNCPTNSKLVDSGAFEDVYIEPHCDDGGLSIGAAWWLWHNLLDKPLAAKRPVTSALALIGGEYDRAIEPALKRFDDLIVYARCSDEAAAVAADLLADKVVAVFRGRSETGPRALGHRSILANPSQYTNWKRVNEVKGREHWRPFAPIILADRLRDFFTGGPDISPFMLMTHQANDRARTQIPAVIHVDGTSRVQTVVPSDGFIHDMLKLLEKEIDVPVVMNTSFNGPGEPIVETPDDALNFLVKSRLLDAVYMNGVKVERRSAH